ncbi:NAD(P)-dependent oxidoreductase [Paraburkholderia sediminicola]|uniref:NAD(P)-dependent oxidoreductase n=1 Tax=Paraburkholderia metrosideri TaxID=580937 RepID=A0ABW9DUA5_9BURK
MTGKVGIVGIGLMGLPMANSLITRGWQVKGYDIDPARRAALQNIGGESAGNLADVAAFSDHLILSLPSGAALQQVIDQLCATTHARHVILETSTLAVDDKERAAAALSASSGARLLDCPLIGGAVQAKEATLSALVSGDEAAWHEIEPVLQALSRQQRYVGTFGMSSRLKFVVNHLVCTTTVLIAETMQFATRAGIDMNLIHEVISNSPASSGIWRARVPLMIAGVYDDPATKAADLAIPFKDTKIIADYIASHGAITPLFDAALKIYAVAQQQDRADQDAAALYEVFGSLSSTLA